MSVLVRCGRLVSWLTCLDGETLRVALGPKKRLAVLLAVLSFLEGVILTFGVGLVYSVVALVVSGPEATGFLGSDNVFTRYLPSEINALAAFGLLLLIFALKSSLSLWRVWTMRNLTESLRVQWTSLLADNILRRTLTAHQAMQDGTKVGTIVREPQLAARCILAGMTYFVNLISIAFMLVLAFYSSWQASLMFGVIGGSLALLARVTLMRRIKRLGQQRIRTNHRMMETIVEAVAAIKDLKALGLEDLMRERLDASSMQFKGVTIQIGFLSQVPSVLTDFVAISVFLTFVYILLMLHGGDVTSLLPQIALFFAVLVKLFSSGSQALTSRAKVRAHEPSLDHIIEVIREPAGGSRIEDFGPGVEIGSIETDIVLDHVTFGHDPEVPVLKDVELTFPKGEVTYVVGPSGIGKTTLVDLLLRYYEPQSGEVRVNGRNIKEFNLRSWRSRIGYAGQEALLFTGTVRENIALANPDASEERIRWAAEVAGAAEFIDSLPEGYDTIVGEKGVTLSGGQRMRLAIARAAVRDPDLVIIDEGTARFELSLERRMVEAMRKLPRKPTVIIITHRQQSTEFGDRVVDFRTIRSGRSGETEVIDQEGPGGEPGSAAKA